jgi:hypothetical protein
MGLGPLGFYLVAAGVFFRFSFYDRQPESQYERYCAGDGHIFYNPIDRARRTGVVKGKNLGQAVA